MQDKNYESLKTIPQNRHEQGHSEQICKCINGCLFSKSTVNKHIQKCPHCNTSEYKLIVNTK